MMRFGDALAAAAFTLTQVEANLDRVIGRGPRLALGRYAAVVVLGAPIAWAVPGFHWERISTFGLIAGLALYAVVDIARIWRRGKKHSRN